MSILFLCAVLAISGIPVAFAQNANVPSDALGHPISPDELKQISPDQAEQPLQFLDPVMGDPFSSFLENKTLSPASAAKDAPKVDAQSNDPLYANAGMWWHPRVRAEEAWSFTRGDNVTVAVVDSGLDMAHQDIAQNVFKNALEYFGAPGVDDDGNGFVDDVNGWDFVDDDAAPTDLNNHGTHVAGIIGAAADNAIGIAGIAPNAKILPVRVLGADGQGFISDVIAGIKYAADLGAQVINMSLGILRSLMTAEGIQEFQDMINYAVGKGSVIVAAAGNNGQPVSQFLPASLDNVISVGATTSSNALASFSNHGPNLDLSAPGTNILSLKPGNQYQALQGTSMASPMVAGVVALMRSFDPTLTYDDVTRRLKYSSLDLGAPGYDDTFGAGLVDAFAAVSTDYYTTGEIKTRWLALADTDGAVRYEYDLTGKISRKKFPDGSYADLTYWPGTSSRFEQIYYDAGGVWQKTFEYYPDGVHLHFERYPDGHVVEHPNPAAPPVISNAVAANITSSSASLKWDTDKPATSQVEWCAQDGTNCQQTTFDSALKTAHDVAVNGLQPSTRYLYRVISQDDTGNRVVSPDGFFTTAAPPAQIELSVISASSGWTRIGTDWMASSNSKYLIYRAPVDEAGDYTLKVSAKNFSSAGWHLPTGYKNFNLDVYVDNVKVGTMSVPASDLDYQQGQFQLKGLSLGTHSIKLLWINDLYKASENGDTNLQIHQVLLVSNNVVLPPQDTTPPAVSNTTAANITTNSVSLKWDTDEPATSQVEWCAENGTNCQQTTLDPALKTAHDVAVTGLQPATRYLYRVISQDASGNRVVSSDNFFTTLPPQDTTPPAVSNTTAANITTNSVSLKWDTDEPATSQVEWCAENGTNCQQTTLDPALKTAHDVAVTGLQPATRYLYRVISQDASGNRVVSSDNFFTTAAAPAQTELSVISASSGWTRIGTDWMASSNSKYLVYRALTNTAGDYTLKVSAKNFSNPGWHLPTGYKNFNLDVYVDNVKVGTMSVPASDLDYQQGQFQLRGLSAGTHSIKLLWINDLYKASENGDTNIQIHQVTLS